MFFPFKELTLDQAYEQISDPPLDTETLIYVMMFLFNMAGCFTSLNRYVETIILF